MTPAGEAHHAKRVRRVALILVGLIAGSMLVAWVAGLSVATRTDTLAPMSPISCVGFLAAAVGAWGLPRRRALSLGGGIGAIVCGAGGLSDLLLDSGTTLDHMLFGTETRISAISGIALILLGTAMVLDGKQWATTRALAILAGALSGSAAIGFVLGVPLFYGPSRPVEMSWQ